MARPSNRILQEHEIVAQFLESNIGAIFNLQQMGEHSSCGDGIDAVSGFAYSPELFMDSGSKIQNLIISHLLQFFMVGHYV
jgi:protein tyrosine phosphatase domain-containing protein 1